MFEVPHSPPSANLRRLALLWMGVAVVNAVATYYYLIFRIVPESVRSFFFNIDIGILLEIIDLVQAIGIAILQWLVLRRFFPSMRLWAVLHGSVLILQLLLFSRPFRKQIRHMIEAIGGSGDTSIMYNIQSLLSALLLGIAGWIIFRPIAPRASLWLWGFLLSKMIEWFISRSPLPSTIPSGSVLYQLIFYSSVLLPAAIQAAVLVSFLRERERPAVATPLAQGG
jgi:hypothetical protein